MTRLVTLKLINLTRPTHRSRANQVALGLSLLAASALLLFPQHSRAATLEEDLAEELVSISKAIEQWGRFDARHNRKGKGEIVSLKELREFIEPGFVRLKFDGAIHSCSGEQELRSSITCHYNFGERKRWSFGYATYKPSGYREFTREQCQQFAPNTPVGVQCLDAIFNAEVIGAAGLTPPLVTGECVDISAIARAMNIKSFAYSRELAYREAPTDRRVFYNIQLVPNRFTQILLLPKAQGNCLELIHTYIMRPI
jgi:hypothetical protein